MIDTSAVKQAFKDASDEEARSLYTWITGAMEVRGLIPIAGAQPQRKRRRDAGQSRTQSAEQQTFLGDKHQ